jgi:NAD(P)-dependent dehydrogenase (short-subunit alcohol dehydrogenase family)
VTSGRTDPAPCAVVTGAGRGIGRAVALELAARGHDVALIARTGSELEDTAREIVARGRRALAVRCDIASAADVERASALVVRDLGIADVLVNNAGVVRRALLHEMREEDWDAVVDVNLKGTFLVTRAFLPRMLERRRGRVVTLGSISSTLGTAAQSAYCAAKWGLVGLTKALAEELRGTGLVTMCVLPGSVSTRMLEGSGFAPRMTPEEVAQLVVYAAVDAPVAMNGSAIEMFGP